MSGQVYQLTQQTCNMCGQPGVQPRTDTQYDRYTRETVTEAYWVCPRCGSRFAGGEISRVKDEKETN